MSDERLLVVVAHPDDETFGTGSLLAHASSLGVECTVACATRGEAGEAVEGTVPDGSTLAQVREDELRSAAEMIGVRRVVVFDWSDSGMGGKAAPHTLVGAPFEDVAETVARVIDDVRPTVVVTLDASDGHRDHARIRDATLDAVHRSAWRPGRVYLHCLPQRLMREWVALLQTQQPATSYLALGELGTPDHDITTAIDVSHLVELREAAMARHRSQTPPFDVMPPDLRHAFLATDSLRRVVPPWDGDQPETSIFST
jgi:LmbE family N-acetylglucosaminyl deacetylase